MVAFQNFQAVDRGGQPVNQREDGINLATNDGVKPASDLVREAQAELASEVAAEVADLTRQTREEGGLVSSGSSMAEMTTRAGQIISEKGVTGPEAAAARDWAFNYATGSMESAVAEGRRAEQERATRPEDSRQAQGDVEDQLERMGVIREEKVADRQAIAVQADGAMPDEWEELLARRIRQPQKPQSLDEALAMAQAGAVENDVRDPIAQPIAEREARREAIALDVDSPEYRAFQAHFDSVISELGIGADNEVRDARIRTGLRPVSAQPREEEALVA